MAAAGTETLGQLRKQLLPNWGVVRGRVLELCRHFSRSARWHFTNINSGAVNHKNCHINYQPGYHSTRPVHNLVAKGLLRGLGKMWRSELGWANLL